MSETLTMANPIETEKIRTHHAKIVVEYTTGEPYYSIEWFDPAKNEYRLGYSSYYIDNVAAWLAEYFEIVEKPKTNADRIRYMTDEELCDLFREIYNAGCDDSTAYSWGRNTYSFVWDEEWLQAPAKGE
jgi:hypothetical protein